MLVEAKCDVTLQDLWGDTLADLQRNFEEFSLTPDPSDSDGERAQPESTTSEDDADEGGSGSEPVVHGTHTPQHTRRQGKGSGFTDAVQVECLGNLCVWLGLHVTRVHALPGAPACDMFVCGVQVPVPLADGYSAVPQDVDHA